MDSRQLPARLSAFLNLGALSSAGNRLVLENQGARLRLVTAPTYDQNAERRIRQRLGQVASELSECVFERVGDVETTRAGKRRWFVDKRTSQ